MAIRPRKTKTTILQTPPIPAIGTLPQNDNKNSSSFARPSAIGLAGKKKNSPTQSSASYGPSHPEGSQTRAGGKRVAGVNVRGPDAIFRMLLPGGVVRIRKHVSPTGVHAVTAAYSSPRPRQGSSESRGNEINLQDACTSTRITTATSTDELDTGFTTHRCTEVGDSKMTPRSRASGAVGSKRGAPDTPDDLIETAATTNTPAAVAQTDDPRKTRRVNGPESISKLVRGEDGFHCHLDELENDIENLGQVVNAKLTAMLDRVGLLRAAMSARRD